jgi:cytoskeletal protein CcmA (bactofilin family)
MKKTIFKLFILSVLVSLLLVPTSAAYAQGPNPDNGGRVIFGENFTLAKGDTFNGDLVVFGGNVTLEDNSNLNGNLVVIGGTIKSNGETKGDVVVVGGQVNLEKSAHVTGDVVTIGSQLARAEGASIEGDVVNNVAPNVTLPNGRIPPAVPNVTRPDIHINYNPFTQVFWILFWAIIVSAFSMLLTLFWQPQIERTGKAIVSQPLMTGAIGLLSFFVALILFLTIIPPIVAAFAWLFGIVAIGSEVGERFTKSLNQTWTPVLTIGFGTFLLMLVGGSIGLIPCLGGLILFLLGMIGIGGSVMTWFGVRPPQVAAMPVLTPPADSSTGSEQLPPAS